MSETRPGLRVVLPAEGVRARVLDGERAFDGVPILTATLAEDEEALMAEAREDAVVLKERSPTAFVRLDGVWHAGVPIYRLRAQPDGTSREVRVTVDEIREKRKRPVEPDAPRKGFLARLFGD